MAKRSVLGWFDRGNQRAMDHVRARPDSGRKILPYAKSDSARRWEIVLLIAISLTGFFFGFIGALIALAIAAPIFWKLEHHFFFGHPNDGDKPDP